MANDENNKEKQAADAKTNEQQLSEIQKKIEEKVTEDEATMSGPELSTELSEDRTAMSEHRAVSTALSEKRSGLSEHRTELSEKRTGMSEHRTDLSDTRTDLSYQRTALSYERTLMSWVRTSTSMITFGFTIYKFFEEVQKENPHPTFFTPRVVGLLMIGFGFIGLLFAQIQHHIAYKNLRKEYPPIQRSLSSMLSTLMLVFGLLLFLAALFKQ